MKLVFHGGVGEIGGNKILVDTNATKLFIDFGVSFASKRKFFGGFVSPRKFSGISDLIFTGVIPDLRGIYRADVLKQQAMTRGKQFVPEDRGLDAVVVSHAHADHAGHVSLLRGDIPIHCGATTLALLEARERVKYARSYEEHVVEYKDPFSEKPQWRKRRFNLFRTGDTLRIGPTTLTPVHVDHSVPAAYGFILEDEEDTIAYTGDLRLHGPKSHLTNDFIEKASTKTPDALVIEGTRIDDPVKHSERRVERDIIKTAAKAENKLCVAYFSSFDIDRLKTFVKVAISLNRKLVISLRVAYLLDHLQRKGLGIEVPVIDGKPVSVHLEQRGSGMYKERDYRGRWVAHLLGTLADRGAEPVRASSISRRQDKYILCTNHPTEITHLLSIRPLPGSLFLFSTSEPHNEEQEIEYEKLKEWINLLGMRWEESHASGHASKDELLDVIERIGAKTVIPVHTDSPELFAPALKERNIKAKVVEPLKGRPVRI